RAWPAPPGRRPQRRAPSAEGRAVGLEALQETAARPLDLRPKAAQAFVMSAVCGMSAAEVGAELAVTSRMVRKYVAQAMLRCMQGHAAQTAAALRQAAAP